MLLLGQCSELPKCSLLHSQNAAEEVRRAVQAAQYAHSRSSSESSRSVPPFQLLFSRPAVGRGNSCGSQADPPITYPTLEQHDAPTASKLSARPLPFSNNHIEGPLTSLVESFGQRGSNGQRTQSKPRLFCTWPGCSATFRHRSEWTRHEEAKHYFSYHWVCCLDQTESAEKVVTNCSICEQSDVSLGHVRGHDEFRTCRDKDIATRTFFRRDHLAQHIRGTHLKSDIRSTNRALATRALAVTILTHAWRIDNTSLSPEALYCGFCGSTFDNWKAREARVFDHFGTACKEQWKARTRLDFSCIM